MRKELKQVASREDSQEGHPRQRTAGQRPESGCLWGQGSRGAWWREGVTPEGAFAGLLAE